MAYLHMEEALYFSMAEVQPHFQNFSESGAEPMALATTAKIGEVGPPTSYLVPPGRTIEPY
jgi:hypothetical protein